jgi:hypothetical protein
LGERRERVGEGEGRGRREDAKRVFDLSDGAVGKLAKKREAQARLEKVPRR